MKLKQVDESSDKQEIELPLGEKLEIRLNENRTTGFQWEFASKGEPVCELIDTSNPSGGQPGQGGRHLWQFHAARIGQGEIKLLYRRLWEREKSPARTFTLYVRVSK